MVSGNSKRRLRNSPEVVMSTKREQYEAGYTRGRIWAELKGEAAGLTRLAELREELDDRAWREGFQAAEEEFVVVAPFQALALILHPSWQASEDWGLARDWWSEIAAGDENAYAPTFLQGFAEGALAVWKATMSDV